MAEKSFEELKKEIEIQKIKAEQLLSTYRAITSELSEQRKQLEKQKIETNDIFEKVQLETELEKNILQIKEVVLENLKKQNEKIRKNIISLKNEQLKLNIELEKSQGKQKQGLLDIDEKIKEHIVKEEQIERLNKEKIKDIQHQISETEKLNDESLRIRKNLEGYAKSGETFVKNTVGSGGKRYFDTVRDMIKSKDNFLKASQSFLKGATQFLKGKNLLALGISTILEQTINVTKELESQSAQTAALTGKQRLFSDEIYDSSRNNRQYGITLSETANSFRTLFSNVSKFTTLSKKSRQELTEFASKMNVFGVSLSTVSKNTEELTMSLRMSSMASQRTQVEIFSLSKSIDFEINRLQEQFAQSIQQLSVYGERGIEIFKNLAGVQKLTGVSVSRLQQIFGSAMDTFDGTARIAGQLNTILGRDLVNSVDLLYASEEQRVRIVLSAIEATGKQFNQLTKHHKLALANAAGIKDISEANKILGMSTLAYDEMMLKTKMAEANQKDFNESIKPSVEFMKKLKVGFQQFAVAVQPVVKVGSFLIDKLLTPTFKLVGGVMNFFDLLLTKITPVSNLIYHFADGVGTIIDGFSDLFNLKFSDFFAKIVDGAVKAAWGLVNLINPFYYLMKGYDYIMGTKHAKNADNFILKDNQKMIKNMISGNKDYTESLKEVKPELDKNTSSFQKLHQVQTKKGSPALWEMNKVMAEGTKEYNQEIKNIKPQIINVSDKSKELHNNMKTVTNSFRKNTNNETIIENIVSNVMNLFSSNKEQREVRVVVDVNMSDIDGTKKSFKDAVVKAINEATR